MRVGFVFAGQGAQYPGMGKELYDNYCEAAAVFDKAGEQIKEWCFSSGEEILKRTNVTQPTVYTVSVAAYKAFSSRAKEADIPIEVSAIAGFSLGEYSALTIAGTIDDVSKGVDIVSRRGRLMREAGQDESGQDISGMVAALGRREDILAAVEEARENGILEGVNFNSPRQTVVAGDKEALKRFRNAAKARKVRAVPLKVSTAFHSPMMIPAAKKLNELLMMQNLKKPEITVISNATGENIMKNYEGGDISEYMAQVMSAQAMSPVFWEETIRKMFCEGVDVIVEFGPGSTLSKLINEIEPSIKAFNVEDFESMERTITGLLELM